jgi:DNA-binding NarL/FixJ family response regulator
MINHEDLENFKGALARAYPLPFVSFSVIIDETKAKVSLPISTFAPAARLKEVNVEGFKFMGTNLTPDNPDSMGKTVLVVDADPAVNEMLAAVLAPMGWNIQNAPDNRGVLDLIESRPFELIITGEKTSALEDVELLNKIRCVRPHTRMIILTDESTPDDIVACIRGRAFSCFSKPFSLASLADMVRSATEGLCWDDGIEIISATAGWIRLVARCDIKTADRLVQFTKEMSDLTERETAEVGTAFREILLNAIEHGGHFDPNQYVEISYVRTQRMVGCRVKDPGEGFSRDELPHAAISNPPDDPIRHFSIRQALNLRPGGFGVLMARNLVDELLYSEKGNEVLLIKYLDGETTG